MSNERKATAGKATAGKATEMPVAANIDTSSLLAIIATHTPPAQRKLSGADARLQSPAMDGSSDGWWNYTLTGFCWHLHGDNKGKAFCKDDECMKNIVTDTQLQAHFLYMLRNSTFTYIQAIQLLPLALVAGNRDACLAELLPRVKDTLLGNVPYAKQLLGIYADTVIPMVQQLLK